MGGDVVTASVHPLRQAHREIHTQAQIARDRLLQSIDDNDINDENNGDHVYNDKDKNNNHDHTNDNEYANDNDNDNESVWTDESNSLQVCM